MSDDGHFDRFHVWYRSVWGDHLHHGWWIGGARTLHEATSHLVAEAAARAGISPGSKVCDVGSGYGGTARKLAREFGAVVTGVTNSRRQHEVAVSLAGKGECHLLADWFANGLADGEFDAVIAIETTPHFENPQAGIREMARVLKPGGRLVISTWLSSEEAGWWAEVLLLGPIRRHGQMSGLSTMADHCRWLEESGLQLLDVEAAGEKVRRTWWACFFETLRVLRHDGRLRRELFLHPWRALSLSLSWIRIQLAYASGLLDYGLFVATKVSAKRQSPAP